MRWDPAQKRSPFVVIMIVAKKKRSLMMIPPSPGALYARDLPKGFSFFAKVFSFFGASPDLFKVEVMGMGEERSVLHGTKNETKTENGG